MVHLIMLGGGTAGAAHAVVKGCSVLVSWGFVLTSGAGVSLADTGAMCPAVTFCLGLVIFRRRSLSVAGGAVEGRLRDCKGVGGGGYLRLELGNGGGERGDGSIGCQGGFSAVGEIGLHEVAVGIVGLGMGGMVDLAMESGGACAGAQAEIKMCGGFKIGFTIGPGAVDLRTAPPIATS